MPCCTYVSENEATLCRTVNDKELDSLLGKIRHKTGRDWIIDSIEYKRLWPFKSYYIYQLRILVGDTINRGIAEYQIINFPPLYDPKASSINHYVPYGQICAYLIGYLGNPEP